MCVCVPVLGCQPDVLVQSVSPFSSSVSQQAQQAWLSREPRNCWEQRKWPRDTELSRCMFQRLDGFRLLPRHLWSSCLLPCPCSLRQPCGSWGWRSPAIPSPAVGVGAAGPSVLSPGVHTPAHPPPCLQRLAAATRLAFRRCILSLSWSLSWQNGL